MIRFLSFLFLLICMLLHPLTVLAAFEHQFKTQQATVFYTQTKDLDDFIWRLGGNRSEFLNDPALASNRIDRIISRVQAMLDMWPESVSLNIYLHTDVLKQNKVAFFDKVTKKLHVSIPYASDGVFAHEVSHAIMDLYFPFSPPSKMQEILAQYVDKHLWSDY